VERGLWTRLKIQGMQNERKRTLYSTSMKSYPGRTHHNTPSWVKTGAIFHIRIRCARENQVSLTEPDLASRLLESAQLYHISNRWFCQLFLLMPDHIHALLAFPPNSVMANIIGAWKGFHAKRHDVAWQANFFDHRLRNDAELAEKSTYIRRNPVVKNLCLNEEDWPWVIAPASE
jgi:REP element-mobilizing transposase RayT